MDPFSKVFACACALAAWWVMAMYAYPALPESAMRVAVLGAASAVLLWDGWQMNRAGRRYAVTFTWSLALACWAFYAEVHYLLDGPSDPRMVHAVTVYNLFRYALLLFTLIILIKDLILSIKNFHS